MEAEKLLYESNIIINPKQFFQFRKNKVVKMQVDKYKNIVFQTEPQTVIPFSMIKTITFNWLFDGAFKIVLHDGKVYRIIWGSADKTYNNPMETADIFNNLKRIIR